MTCTFGPLFRAYHLCTVASRPSLDTHTSGEDGKAYSSLVAPVAVPVGPGLQPTAAGGIGRLKGSVSFILLVGEARPGKTSPKSPFRESAISFGQKSERPDGRVLVSFCLETGRSTHENDQLNCRRSVTARFSCKSNVLRIAEKTRGHRPRLQFREFRVSRQKLVRTFFGEP